MLKESHYLVLVLCASFFCISSVYSEPVGEETDMSMDSIRSNIIKHSQEGQLFLEREQYGNAVSEFKIALQLNPSASLAAPLYNNLGVAFRESGEYLFAVASFQRAIRLTPSTELYYKNLVATYDRFGKLVKAYEGFGRTTKINPSDGEAWFLLGLINERVGRTQMARQAFKKCRQLEPNSLLAEAAKSHL
ncbi:MAG: tetratricopeptide repeat protein [Cyanobacteria bacterium]|nr:tetratricopeptide repeat protein [Cyanobacteriota bacterium]